MKQLLILTFMLSCLQSQAQILIGSNPAAIPNASTILELDANNKGMLIPRMTDVERLAITAPVQGLWVYQNNINPGYFFFTGTEWVRVAYNRTLPGKVGFNQVTSAITIPPAYGAGVNGYTSTYLGNGEYDVSFNTNFANPPVVTLTAESVEPPALITGAQQYCEIGFSQLCTTFFNADYIDRVRIQSHNGVMIVPASGFNNANTGCNGNPNNYTNYFNGLPAPTPVIEATLYGEAMFPGAFFNITMNSGPEWKDPLFAFIDWNQNGQFEETEAVLEEYFSLLPNGTNNPAYAVDVIEAGLTVPPCAANGITAMRTIAQFSNGLPETCTDGTQSLFGEVEDYKLTIVGNVLGGCAATGPQSVLCNPSEITVSGFKVACATASGGTRTGTSFEFYATEY